MRRPAQAQNKEVWACLSLPSSSGEQSKSILVGLLQSDESAMGAAAAVRVGVESLLPKCPSNVCLGARQAQPEQPQASRRSRGSSSRHPRNLAATILMIGQLAAQLRAPQARVDQCAQRGTCRWPSASRHRLELVELLEKHLAE